MFLLLQDFYSKKPKGFAFVEFHDERDADEAMYRLQGYEIDGRRISIVVAKDRRKSADEMRPRGGGRRNSRSRERRDDGGRGREERGGEVRILYPIFYFENTFLIFFLFFLEFSLSTGKPRSQSLSR